MTIHNSFEFPKSLVLSLWILLCGPPGSQHVQADDLPKNANPSAIYNDWAEPNWDERISIHVGQTQGEVRGESDKAIQSAIDYVARRGGGTVRIGAGTYRLRNSIFLQTNVRLLGSGVQTVLLKEPSSATKLIVDGDHWDQGETGVAIDVQGDVDGIEIVNNLIEESRGPAKRSGIRIAPEAKDIRCDGNRIKGLAVTIADQRQK